MASPLIQFRLKDDALQALEAFRLDGESLNLCAQRLLMGALNVDSTVDRINRSVDTVDKAVDTVDKETLIENIKPRLSTLIITDLKKEQEDYLDNWLEKNLPKKIEACLGKDQAR